MASRITEKTLEEVKTALLTNTSIADAIEVVKKKKKSNKLSVLAQFAEAYNADFEIRKKADELFAKENPFLSANNNETTTAISDENLRTLLNASKKLTEYEAAETDFYQKHIMNWTKDVPIPSYHDLKAPQIIKNGRRIILTCFDWHIGARCGAEHTLRGVGWNTEEALKCVRTITEKFIRTVEDSKAGYEEVIIVYGGDLFHSTTNFTAKGTMLQTDKEGGCQFNDAFFAIRDMVIQIARLGLRIRNYFVKGNHGGETDYGLGWALKQRFEYDPSYKGIVTWEVGITEALMIEADRDTLLCLTHGASAYTNHKLMAGSSPTNEKNGVRYFDSYQQRSNKVFKHKILIVGDKHHHSSHEYNGFHMVQVGSLMKADRYAEGLNLRARSQQACINIDNEGYKGVTMLYAD